MRVSQNNEAIAYETRLLPEEAAVLRILLYFDLFQHPLLTEEIASYSEQGMHGLEEVRMILKRLHMEGLIKSWNSYYFINHSEKIVQRRLEGEKHAMKALARATWFSGLMARFPFVRGISLSGSISKIYMDKQSDIDYFIVTSPGRMWVSRTLLVIFKKIFLFNSHKYFCINYFVTEESLPIPNRNLFSATEMAFLIPTYNLPLYRKLMQENEWYRDYYPQLALRDARWVSKKEKFILKPILEKLLSGKAGEKLDSFFFRLTLDHWKKKFKHFDPDTFDLRLRCRKNESKHHPLGYQEKVLAQYEKNLVEFEHRHSVNLHL